MKSILQVFFLVFVMTSCAARKNPSELRLDRKETQKIKVGRFESRALWTPSSGKSPAILMLPGSGPQGPEEMIPGKLTVDGKNAPLFIQLAEPFIEAGFNVLALGKPGVNFYSENPEEKYYDIKMIKQLTWQNLLDNAKDGIDFLRKQDSVDSDKIYVLGHSEGTQVATDLTIISPPNGLILLGYSGEDLLTTLKWQLTDRGIDHFVKTDVDSNRDGFVTQLEGKKWAGLFAWDWKPGQDQVSIEDLRNANKNDPKIKDTIKTVQDSFFCSSGGKCDRGPIYDETAQFAGPIHVFTGELDLQTRPEEALRLRDVCARLNKKNCYVDIVPGVQHGFSAPRGPRRHPLLDMTLGPVDASFQRRLFELAKEIDQKQ